MLENSATLAQTWQAADACPGLVFAVAENAQFIPDVLKAKELIDSGAIGDVYPLRGTLAMCKNGSQDPRFVLFCTVLDCL